MSEDLTPGQIVVWTCATCGWWATERSKEQGAFKKPGHWALKPVGFDQKPEWERHEIVESVYVYEGDVAV